MPLYSVSYDLVKREEYESFWVELERLGATRYLRSHWAVRTPDHVTAQALGIHLRQFIDRNDSLFVIRLDEVEWAAFNTLLDLASL